jgi:hypothetical protein
MGDSNGWGRFEWGHDWNPRVETSRKGPVVGMGGVVFEWESGSRAMRRGCDRIRM